MNLEQLKESLKVKTAGLKVFKDAAMKDDATNDDIAALETAVKDVEDLQKKIALLEKTEEAEAMAAKAPETPAAPAPTVPAQPIEKLSTMDKIGLGMAGMFKAYKEEGQKGWNAIADKMDKMGYGAVAQEFDSRNKALNSGTGSAGGFAIAEDFNQDIFDSLAPYTAFLRGKPDSFPMPNGNYRQSGEAARPTAAYRGEGAVIAASEPTLREINMSAKLLSGLVPMTNQIINYTAQRAAAWAQRSLITTVGLTMDTAAFEGTGAGNNPLGLYNIGSINSVVAVDTAAPTHAQVDADLRKLLNPIAQFALLQLNVAWVMTQRVKGYLEDMKDGNGNYVYPTLQKDNPTLKGKPVLVCGTISDTEGAGTNESTIGLINFDNILLGESGGMKLAISDEASYDSGSGTMVSAFANDMTLIRATMEHDWTSRYVEAINVLTAVKWGA